MAAAAAAAAGLEAAEKPVPVNDDIDAWPNDRSEGAIDYRFLSRHLQAAEVRRGPSVAWLSRGMGTTGCIVHTYKHRPPLPARSHNRSRPGMSRRPTSACPTTT